LAWRRCALSPATWRSQPHLAGDTDQAAAGGAGLLAASRPLRAGSAAPEARASGSKVARRPARRRCPTWTAGSRWAPPTCRAGPR
jgi:hypothetical protein